MKNLNIYLLGIVIFMIFACFGYLFWLIYESYKYIKEGDLGKQMLNSVLGTKLSDLDCSIFDGSRKNSVGDFACMLSSKCSRSTNSGSSTITCVKKTGLFDSSSTDDYCQSVTAAANDCNSS